MAKQGGRDSWHSGRNLDAATLFRQPDSIIEGLVDTGSNRTLIGKEARQKFYGLDWMVDWDSNSRVRLANGAVEAINELVTGEIGLRGRERCVTVY